MPLDSSAICPHCQRPLQPANGATGATAMCRECGQVFEAVEPTSSREPTTKNWLLIGAVTLGIVGVVIAIRFVPAWIADNQKKQAIENGLQIVTGIVHFESNIKRFPAAYSVDASGRPLLSWRVHLLPHLGEEALYKQFHLNEPWDSPHNSALLERMPAIYQSPGLSLPAGHTCWLATVGDRSVIAKPGDRRIMWPGFGIRHSDIPDGTSQTIALVEVNPSAAVPWTAPRDYQYDLQNPLRDLGGIRPGPSFLVGFGDAHISTIRLSTPDLEETLRRKYQRDNWAEKTAAEDDME